MADVSGDMSDNKDTSASQVILTQTCKSKNCIIEADINKTLPQCNSVTDRATSSCASEILQRGKPLTAVNSSGFINITPNAPTQNSNTIKLQQSDNENLDSNSCVSSPKKKNARKRETHNLHLQMPINAQHNIPATAQAPAPRHPAPTYTNNSINVPRNEMPPVHEFFNKFITPMYAPTNPRYLENLRHHPSFQIENMGQVYQAGSVPSSPAFVPRQQFHSGSYPNSPYMVPEPNSPRFMQNVLQHPLLSQSFSTPMYNNMHQPQFNLMSNYFVPYLTSYPVVQGNQGNQTPPQKYNKKGKKTDINITFDPYLSIEEVEAGLKEKSLFEGVIRINPKQYQHAYISTSDRSEQDVFIDGMKNRNRALEGDIVVVQFINDNDVEENQEQTNRRGKVVYIKEKVHTRTCIGTLKLMTDMNRQKAIFMPRDNRIPRLFIPFTSWPNNFYNDVDKYENVLFLALIEEWTTSKYAIGKIISQIGISGDMEVERRAILAETDLDITPYGPEYREYYPRLDYIIPEEEIKRREDCRNMCIFSIDPFNCRDIDDAVSCRKLDNGNYEVGVHISDVAHYLAESTKLDEKVADKATTIYLVDKAYHMLPDELCMLCSLFPGVDKLAFSVFWEMTDNATVLSHRFSKTVINSCCQLAYEHAQVVLEGKEDAEASFPEFYNGYTYSDVYETIKLLGNLSSTLRKQRFDTGALRIDQPKLQFTLSPANGMPESFEIYESKMSHQLIEEFMLLANMTVARRIIEDHPNLAFLRCHPPPSGYMFRQLATELKTIGIEIDISSAGDLHRTVLPHVGPENTDKGKAMVLSMLCAKPMTRARYFCAGDAENEDYHHYALNVPLYTHFTSPIRRYADIMVHRLLSASLNYMATPTWKVDYVKQVAAQCNKQKYNAKKAGELSSELYILKYIELRSPMVIEAAVVEVRERYIDFIIVAMGLNKRMFFGNDFPGKCVRIKNEAGNKFAKMEVTWNATKDLPSVTQVLEVFSVVKVEMFKDDMAKIGMRLVRPH